MRGKIDPIKLREMIKAGHTAGEICAEFSVTAAGLSKFLRAHRITPPARAYRGKIIQTKPERATQAEARPEPAATHPPRLAALIATGGRYADLAVWAKDWDVSEVKARQEWHRLRLPLVRGK